MCAISFIGDHFRDKFYQEYPAFQTWVTTSTSPAVSKEEFDALKKDVAEMKELLKKAKLYDEQTGQPGCEMEEKVALLKKVAELVGVDLSEVFGRENQKTS